jgi:predicted transcriptional regulator of viral defense system
MAQTKMDELLDLVAEKGILRARDLKEHGIPREYLRRLTERGELVRLGRGLYQHADHDVTAQHSLAEAAKRVPKGVLCLLSALRVHGLTTQNPFDIWMAIGHKDREPTVEHLSLRIVRMSGEARTEGIETRDIEGVSVPVYGPAKTVADCFKFRSRVGTDVAIEALRDFHRTRAGTMDELWHYAEICRVRTVIKPYMEAIV